MEDRPPAPPDSAYSTSFGTPPPPPPPAAVLPWEQPGLDVFTAFGRTVAMLISSPRQAFEIMPVTSSLGRPLAFAIIVGWIAVLAGTFWDMLLRDWITSMLPGDFSKWNTISATARIVTAMLAPIWLTVAIFIGSGIQHLFLMMLGGATRGFAATFRVGCYAWVTLLLGLIPICGRLAGTLWGLVLLIIGLSVAHRISTGKAAFAALLPLLLCCACVITCIALFGAAVLGLVRAHGG